MLLLKHTIEYLTNNGELDTSDGQRLLTTSLEKLAKSNLSDLKDCDCRKDWEIRILFGKTKQLKSLSSSAVDVDRNSAWRVIPLSWKPQLVQGLQYVT